MIYTIALMNLTPSLCLVLFILPPQISYAIAAIFSMKGSRANENAQSLS